MTLTVLGWGFFAPTFASADDALGGVHRAALAPAFTLVQGRLRRFTSLVTQMHLEVCGQALARAQIAGDQVLSVFASTVGESHTSIELLRGITEQGVASAARFAQSVHSTPSGIFSIATRNRLPSYAIAADAHSFDSALLEARLLHAESGRPVLLSMADDVIPSLLRSRVPGAALAGCLILGAGGRTLPESRALGAPHLAGSALVPLLDRLAQLHEAS